MFDLRVDDHADPLGEMRRLLTLQRAYRHMNAGDAAMEASDREAALREYGAGRDLVPRHIEMAYWNAIALVNMGRVDESLPMFRVIFAEDENWAILTPRLPSSGLSESEIHERSAGSTPYETEYPMLRVMEVAELAAAFDAEAVAPLERALDDPDSAVRFWAVQGLLARGELDELSDRLADTSPSVRAIAAEAWGRFGNDAQRERALAVLIDLASLERYDIYVVMLALNALDGMDRRALNAFDSIRALPTSHPSVMPVMKSYVPRLVEQILADSN